uniref:protein-serine/threonine phosphatase n=1 Tax=Oryza glumipatula TaxID=40148 RepID=A0A0E0ANI2_9ORYZ
MVVVEDPAAAFREALPAANAEMHAADEVDDSMSGTTAVAALVAGGALHVANVGDSRAVAGVWREGRVAAEELSKWDNPSLYIQTRCTQPKTQPEYDFGICSVQGKHEIAPVGHRMLHARVRKTSMYRDVYSLWITEHHQRFTDYSEGEVAAYEDPREACSAIAAESYKLWLEHENRTDDITIIIVHIRDSENPGPAGSQKMNGSSSGAVQPELTVFVPSEASHLNRDAATEMPSSSSGSPTEQHLSCVAPSPTHPLLGVGRTSETPKLIESERAMSQPAEASWHQRDGSCCCAMAVVLALQSVRHAPVANPLGAVARVFLRAPAD